MASSKTKLSAKDILIQAALTIESTYWIKGEEHEGLSANDLDDAKAKGQKFIKLPALPDQWMTAVTGVCSVGAISLTVATKRKEMLRSYDELAGYDLATRKAGEALADVLRHQRKWQFDMIGDNDALNIIATWNDDKERTRAQVVKAFNKALESPLLNARNLWTIAYRSDWRFEDVHSIVFATKQEADEFLTTLQARRPLLIAGKKPKPVNHKADAIATQLSDEAFNGLIVHKIEGLS